MTGRSRWRSEAVVLTAMTVLVLVALVVLAALVHAGVLEAPYRPDGARFVHP
jgi:hypothetical protein